MNARRRQLFTLHELLIMAALAALGGMSGSVVSMVGKAVQAAIGVPGGLQFLAGIHVLWLIIAVGLVRKPGAATMTGLLKGMVELLTGNPHGLPVVVCSLLAGVCVDAIWLLCGRRNHPIPFMLGGGLGAASNMAVFKVLGSFSFQGFAAAFLSMLAVVAFVSGVFLAGLLGWVLLASLRRAGIAGPEAVAATQRGERRT